MKHKKIFLVLKIGIFSLLLIMLYTVYANFNRAFVEKNITHITQDISEKTTEKLNYFFKILFERANISQYSFVIRSFLEDAKTRTAFLNDSRLPQIIDDLDMLSSASIAIDSAMLASLQAQVYVESNGFVSPIEWNLTQRPYFTALKDSSAAILAEPYVSAKGDTLFTFFNPIRDKDKKLLGALGLHINVTHLSVYLNSLSDNTYELSLISPDNKIVASTNINSYSKNIADSDFPLSVKNKLLTNQTGNMWTKTDYNTRFLYAIIPMQTQGWRIVIADTQKGFLKHAKASFYSEQSLILFIFLLITMVLTGFFIYFTVSAELKYRHIHYDWETGFLSRKGFFAELENLFRKKRKHLYVAVFIRIKQKNVLDEQLGKNIGNDLILYMAECLKKFLIHGEKCGHFDGSNYGLILYFSSEYACINRLKKLSKEFNQFGPLLERNYSVHVACGCYVLPIIPEPVTQIDQHLGLMLHKASFDGNSEDAFLFYTDEYKETILLKKEIADYSHAALKNGEFVFYLQGKYTPETGILCSAEALVRWNHSQKGFLSPASFISIFEENNFITHIDFYILKKVCEQQKMWLTNGFKAVPVSVNFSRNHLTNKYLAEDILAVIDEYQIPHELIEIEITESALGSNIQNLTTVIKKLDASHIQTSIDDFGTGYSTLSTLKNLLVHTLKIDREFFIGMEENKRAQTVVSTVLQMAKELGLKTVAEGIETLEQVDFLKSKNIDLIQGFYYSKPIPIFEFQKLLQNCTKDDTKK